MHQNECEETREVVGIDREIGEIFAMLVLRLFSVYRKIGEF